MVLPLILSVSLTNNQLWYNPQITSYGITLATHRTSFTLPLSVGYFFQRRVDALEMVGTSAVFTTQQLSTVLACNLTFKTFLNTPNSAPNWDLVECLTRVFNQQLLMFLIFELLIDYYNYLWAKLWPHSTRSFFV